MVDHILLISKSVFKTKGKNTT